MSRLLFEKTGSAVWMSHLDLMRVFQRAFRRAEMLLKHTQGYTPHAFVSIVLPLSVGIASSCELMDFELDPEDTTPHEEIPQRLNKVLPSGVRVLDIWENGRKIRELTYLRARLTLFYDEGVPSGCVQAIEALFSREALIVERQKKKECVSVDIRPMIRSVAVTQENETTVTLRAVVCAQNPSLNPQLLVQAVETYLPELTPDFSTCAREEVLDSAEQPFR